MRILHIYFQNNTQTQERHEGQNEIYLRFLFSIRYTLRDSPETNVRYA